MLELETFAEQLLDCFVSLAMTEELLSFLDELLLSTLTGSSFGPAEDEESSPQAAHNIAAATIAITNFFIKNFQTKFIRDKCSLFYLQNDKRRSIDRPISFVSLL